MIVGAAAAGVAALAYWRFLRALPAATRQLFVASGAMFLLGALGIEAISAMHADLFGRANFHYAVLTTIEETFEMLGIAVFAIALMEYLRDHVGELQFSSSP